MQIVPILGAAVDPTQTRFFAILYALLALSVATFLFPQLSRLLDNRCEHEIGGSFSLWLTRFCSVVSVIVIIHHMRHPDAVLGR